MKFKPLEVVLKKRTKDQNCQTGPFSPFDAPYFTEVKHTGKFHYKSNDRHFYSLSKNEIFLKVHNVRLLENLSLARLPNLMKLMSVSLKIRTQTRKMNNMAHKPNPWIKIAQKLKKIHSANQAANKKKQWKFFRRNIIWQIKNLDFSFNC